MSKYLYTETEKWARQFVHDCVVTNEKFEDRVKKLVEKLEKQEEIGAASGCCCGMD